MCISVYWVSLMKESVKVLILSLVHSFKALSVLHSHSQHLLHLVVAAIGGQVYPVEAATKVSL